MTGSSTPVAQRVKQLWLRVAAPAVKRLQGVLTCGLTPRKLALTLCLGTAIGILPLVWGTTLICIVLAQHFRLNHVALQSVNYLLYPVQLALLVPFFKLGAWLFPWGPQVPANMLFTLFHNPALSSLNLLAWITLTSIAAWLVTALPAALLAYGILRAAASGKERHKDI